MPDIDSFFGGQSTCKKRSLIGRSQMLSHPSRFQQSMPTSRKKIQKPSEQRALKRVRNSQIPILDQKSLANMQMQSQSLPTYSDNKRGLKAYFVSSSSQDFQETFRNYYQDSLKQHDSKLEIIRRQLQTKDTFIVLIKSPHQNLLIRYVRSQTSEINQSQGRRQVFGEDHLKLSNFLNQSIPFSNYQKENVSFLQMAQKQELNDQEFNDYLQLQNFFNQDKRIIEDLETKLEYVVKSNKLIQSKMNFKQDGQIQDLLKLSCDLQDKLTALQLNQFMIAGLQDKQQSILQTFTNSEVFQSDCKICFGGNDSDNNKVVYCDSCPASFHRICYLMKTIPPDNFFCDMCNFRRIKELPKDFKSQCFICKNYSFPQKLIDGQLFHVTCLILNNFSEVQDGKLSLRKRLTIQAINDVISLSEVTLEDCFFCGSSFGLRQACSQLGCMRSFHHICAFLYGSLFSMKIVNNFPNFDLKIELTCGQHLPLRDNTQQAYLRRYITGYRGTSNVPYSNFQEHLALQNQRLRERQQSRIQLVMGWKSISAFMQKKGSIK